MIRVTRWSPDTCDCIFHYQWDDAVEGDKRTHDFKEAERLCEHHKTLAPDKAYDAMRDENTRKNLMFGDMRDFLVSVNHPIFSGQEFDAIKNMMVAKAVESGDSVDLVTIEKDTKETLMLKNYLWSFDKKRVLSVSMPYLSLSTLQKTQIQSAADSKYGTGKVKVL